MTESARARLIKLLPPEAAGFSVDGFAGTCRGSTPALQPVKEARPGQAVVRCNELTFFVAPEIAADFTECTLDYDGALFGKGLTATWPHRPGCACKS